MIAYPHIDEHNRNIHAPVGGELVCTRVLANASESASVSVVVHSLAADSRARLALLPLPCPAVIVYVLQPNGCIVWRRFMPVSYGRKPPPDACVCWLLTRGVITERARPPGCPRRVRLQRRASVPHRASFFILLLSPSSSTFFFSLLLYFVHFSSLSLAADVSCAFRESGRARSLQHRGPFEPPGLPDFNAEPTARAPCPGLSSSECDGILDVRRKIF